MTMVPHARAHPPATRSAVGRRPDDWMVRQLPDQMVAEEHSFFVRFVRLFQSMGDGLLEHADNVEHLADVSVTPEPMVEWLGSWIGTEGLDPTVPEQLRRRFTAQAARGLVWRGTVAGLSGYLSELAGTEVAVVDDGGVRRVEPDDPWRERPGPPVVRITVPDNGTFTRRTPGQGSALEPASGPVRARIPLETLVALVRAEVPAHVVAELRLGTELVWTSEEDEPS